MIRNRRSLSLFITLQKKIFLQILTLCTKSPRCNQGQWIKPVRIGNRIIRYRSGRKPARFNYRLYLSVFSREKNLKDNLERIILMSVSKNHSKDLISSAHLAVKNNNVVVPDMSLDSIANLQLDVTWFWMISKVNSFIRALRTIWSSDGTKTPSKFWLGGFFFPQSFLTSILMDFARKETNQFMTNQGGINTIIIKATLLIFLISPNVFGLSTE